MNFITVSAILLRMWIIAVIRLLAHFFIIDYATGLSLSFHDLIFFFPLLFYWHGNIIASILGILFGAPAIFFCLVGPRYSSTVTIYFDIG